MQPALHTVSAQPMSDRSRDAGSALAHVRSRRLRQVSWLVILGLTVPCAGYVWEGQWGMGAICFAAIVSMGICLWLDRTGQTERANRVLLIAVMMLVSAMLWFGEGMRDLVLLAYPIVLVVAGLLVSARFFAWLLVAMLAFVAFLTVATEVYGWRSTGYVSPPFEVLRDAILLLLACGALVWIFVNDLRQAVVKLQREIEHVRESQKHLTYLSQHDLLTGLPNRGMGRERIAQAIALAHRNRQRVALLFVDLDNFKAINDSLGHQAGDDALKMAADRLRGAVRQSDIVTRHGGDEFVLALSELDHAQDVTAIAALVMNQLVQPFVANDTDISMSCSIGIALFPDDGNDYDTLLRLADIAMYQAKEAGRNTYRLFDAAMNVNLAQSLLLISQLRNALARGEFVLHYQPVVTLATRQLQGAEALVRWQHPESGLLAPAHFIAAAEKSGLIVELGEWVLHEACAQLARWLAAGHGELVMAVNLSPIQFRRGDIDQVVQRALQQSGVPARLLELEITESTLIQDSEKFMQTLHKLKALGVRIAIDDFGTGYSNLSYLQRFAIDKLKIDRSFVARVHQSAQDRAIVKAIIQLAQGLALTTTAEGLENPEDTRTLLALGCQLGQGYLFARPQDATAFEKHLATRHFPE